jgi:hypothetical protein
VRRRDELAAPPPVKPEPAKPRAKAKRPAPTRARPSELERTEAEIAEREARIADLERKLAEDWSDADMVAAHRAARDELQSLLARWEQLFDQAQA